MSKARDIIEWYAVYSIDQGIDVLLTARQKLSVCCVDLANEEKKASEEYLKVYHKRKVMEAQAKLKANGTGVEKEVQAIIETKSLREEEAMLEGRAKGAKVVLGSYNKVLDSMASIINTTNKI